MSHAAQKLWKYLNNFLTFLDNFYITQCTSVKTFSVDGIIRVFYYFYIYLVHFHAIVLSHSPFKRLMPLDFYNPHLSTTHYPNMGIASQHI